MIEENAGNVEKAGKAEEREVREVREVRQLQKEVDGYSTAQVLRWAAEHFVDKIVFASSFGAEDMVLLDMIASLQLPIPIITLDTGRLPGETYQLIEGTKEKYHLPITVYVPDKEKVETLVNTKGFFSFRQGIDERKECCAIRKIEPLRRALAGKTAWITGLRREQAITRSGAAKVELDKIFPGMIKINPLLEWTDQEVWHYIRENNVPYNALHDQNYPSIGCAPCTRAIQPGEDVRAGRWWWERPEHKECGLHR